jgi:hypothetical protein
MYDIYLLLNSQKEPKWSNLTAKEFVPKMDHCLQQRHLGFLGLNLSGDTAAELLEQLTVAGGRGLVVSAAYRQPKVTFEMAKPIAKEAIASKQKRDYPNYTYGAVQLFSEGPLWWKFGAVSPELVERGYIPATLYALVDKLDGHLWTRQEQGCFHLHGEEYHLESASTLSPKQLLHLLASKLGLEWGTDYRYDNQICLKGPAFVVWAVKHTFPALIETQHSFRPTVHLRFRIIPYKSEYESATLLLLQAVMKVLRHDSRDAVLAFDNDTLVPLLEQVSGQLVLGEGWESWSERQPVSRSALASLIWKEEPRESKERWNGKQAVSQSKHALSAAEGMRISPKMVVAA